MLDRLYGGGLAPESLAAEPRVDPLTAAIFRRLRAVLAEQGADLVVVLIPYRRHMEPGLDDDRRLAYVHFLESEGIRHLDLWEPFRAEAAGGTKLYFDIDPHWSPAGHELAADLIYDYLMSTEAVARQLTSEG